MFFEVPYGKDVYSSNELNIFELFLKPHEEEEFQRFQLLNWK